jgi:S1-C subfamily serine protease
MKDLNRFMEDADRYLDGQMPAGEREQFEALCSAEAEAARLLQEQATLRDTLTGYADKTALRRKMDDAHRRWEQRQAATPAAAGRVFMLKGYIWKAVGAAAAVALLITACGFWLTQNYSTHKINSYTVLRREIDNIKRSQNSLLNDIHSRKTVPANPGQYGGTGFALSSEGYIVTNAHVIAGADSIYVENSRQEAFRADLVYEDPHADLAILKVADSTFRLPQLPYRLSRTPVPLGDEVYTMGYPRNEIVYGKGYISAETGFRGDSDSYQISVPVNPGNSGGPVIDSRGQVLGIITGKQSPSDDIAFAVKSSFLVNMLDSLPTSFNKKALLRSQSSLSGMPRTTQLKKLQPFIFLVKVYN